MPKEKLLGLRYEQDTTYDTWRRVPDSGMERRQINFDDIIAFRIGDQHYRPEDVQIILRGGVERPQA
jgi:hypothetical protein